LGVTVLTSVSQADLQDAGSQPGFKADLSKIVLQRAEMANAAGCAGIVCSGLEAKTMKATFGTEFVVVTPGIRPQDTAGTEDDQRRIMTPARAVANGSDYLVIGRPIRDADDPKMAAKRIAQEIEAVI
jgi:orotidine-5'-phosphate decarboxylase